MKQFKGIFKHLSTYGVRGALLTPCLAMSIQLLMEWIPSKEKGTDSWVAVKLTVSLSIPQSDHKLHSVNPLFLLRGLSLEPNFQESWGLTCFDRFSIFGGGLLRKRKVTFFRGDCSFYIKIKSNLKCKNKKKL